MKTIRTGNVDKLVLRLVQKDGAFVGVIIGQDGGRKMIEGDVADDVWRRLHDEAGKANPKYFGFDGARARFRRFFPNGFQSEAFARWERDYKVAAKSKLDLTVPLADAANGYGFGEGVLSVFRATNLLSPFEKTRLQDVLRGPAADPFIRAAARFAMGEKAALGDMERALKPHNSAKWTVVTYLPFLWRPETHMFLKPEVTRGFAARVGHRFASDYEPRLDIGVYDSLLDLTAKTTAELAELQPRDRIDVQSFIWVVGDYKEEASKKQNDDKKEGNECYYLDNAPGSDWVEAPEVVLGVGGEGGSLTIVGVRAADGWHFRFVRDETTLCALLNAEDREGLEFWCQSDWVQSFESALALLDQYPWHKLYPLQVHPDFKRQTWAAVQKRFDKDERGEPHRNLERWSELCG